MEVFNLIAERRSYRGAYENTPVPREDLKLIMQAGLDAPSGCNAQTTSLIAVDDKEVLEKVKSVISPKITETAPAFICVLTEEKIVYRNKAFNIQDYSAAIQNMLVAVKALGYESCWYEGHLTDEDNLGKKVAHALGVPEQYDLICILPVGKATEKPRIPQKKPFEERAWFNGYANFDK